MEFRILGPVELRLGDRKFALGRAKERALLGVLMLNHGKVVSLRTVIEALWDDNPPTHAKKDLQAYISRLRAALRRCGASARIVTQRAGYLFLLEDDELDYARFKALVRDSGITRRAGRLDDAAAALREAMDLWHGLPVEDLSTVWMERTREDLDLYDRVAGYQALCAVELERGHFREVLQILDVAMVEHEFDTEYIAQRLAALDGLGHYEEFDAYWKQVYDRSARSFGTGPARELQELHRRLLQSRDVLAPADFHRTQAALRALPPAQLPSRVSGFVGRSADLARLDELLLRSRVGGSPATLIVAITGPAGVGKTELGLHWAHGVREQFPHGQLHADLSGYGSGPPRDPADVLAEFLDALGVAAAAMPASLSARTAMLRTLLDDRRVLFFLDNARDSEQVEPLLPGSAQCVVVVTSRHRLSDLVTRRGAYRLEAGRFTGTEVAQLLAGLLRESPVARPDPATVVALTGGTPQAVRTLAELLPVIEELPGPAELLLAGELASGTILTSLLWSCDALGPHAARLFRSLALHVDQGIAGEAVCALDGTDDETTRGALAELGSRYLVSREDGRYRMDPLTRAAGERLALTLDPRTDRLRAQARLLDWYIARVTEAAETLTPTRWRSAEPARRLPDYAAAKTFLAAEEAWLSAAIHRAASSDLARAATLLRLLRPHLAFTGVGWRESAEAVLLAARAATDLDAEGQALTALARIHRALGDPVRAEESLQLAATIFRVTHDNRSLTEVLLLLAGHAEDSGDRVYAESCLRQALEVQSGLEEPAQCAAVHGALGAHLRRRERLEEASGHLSHAKLLYAELGDDRRHAGVALELGRLSRRTGRVNDAVRFLTEAVTMHDRHPADHEETLAALVELSEAGCDAGAHGDVLLHARKALGISRSPTDHSQAVRALVALVRSLAATGRQAEAWNESRQTIALVAELDDPVHDHVRAQFSRLGLWPARLDP
ncbi:BTAD domain-containing putative transcriptional regulator [Amycolatopsis sp. DG1A-15b]|uniref:AfsR/SARP family transcriptional regulator n=1 Tax=Amycolatopsis sp. DG1A-15b TaxID=3052846 RepID=UPI00255B9273|nr:BTAD domain-containing putative transcriptional regulator [Amycolatopsis sp. DG1A-15b]WIX88164.1 BTAD domain-containing putative transcriptional regulator [Amycolatopsis sp. DG1A-15b]